MSPSTISPANIRFYSTVFGVPPTVEKPDYAKWMLEDPRINFAISQRGLKAGIDHLGFQLESDEELSAQRAQVEHAEVAAVDQKDAACCYARSDKYWITDPQGIAWETFRTLDAVPVYGSTERPEAAERRRKDVVLRAIARRPSPSKPAKSGACCS